MNDHDRRARLREIDTDLRALRAEQVAPMEGAGDSGDEGQNLHEREELAYQIEGLEAERQRLADALDGREQT